MPKIDLITLLKSSVTQFDLGIKDRNGKAICAGDRVQLYKHDGYGMKSIVGTIVFSPTYLAFGIEIDKTKQIYIFATADEPEIDIYPYLEILCEK